MNEKAKAHIQRVNTSIITNLKANFPSILLFRDEITSEEASAFEQGTRFWAMVFVLGALNPTDNRTKLTQTLQIDYYSEDRDDVDETVLDIISTLLNVKTVEFVNTIPLRAKVKDTDRFVDVISINFRRSIPIECTNRI
ncbi:hypothetical protein ACFPYN_03055 [Paenisporosarcina macmurdoensis]|uniref:DUF3168 domain-containing protein n=1 Tax=Paenisporosarcina macmurdoensis TaxID=212659 RepID=A0ABW1L4K4_9BACL